MAVENDQAEEKREREMIEFICVLMSTSRVESELIVLSVSKL